MSAKTSGSAGSHAARGNERYLNPVSAEDQRILDPLEDAVAEAPKRQVGRLRIPHPEISGQGKTIGDPVAPIVDEGDWECLK
jgi:hypothetical protein